MVGRKQYYVVEQKKGGKNWRRMNGSTSTVKADSERYKKGVQKAFGDRFNYRLRIEYK